MQITIDNLSITQADIRQLSSQWEHCVKSIDYISSGTALLLLTSLVKSYLTGRGYATFNSNVHLATYDLAARLTTTVLLDATKKSKIMSKFHPGIQSYLSENHLTYLK
jgi:hypothetical protein